jgi:Spy/CpxP family protein refolding chaperone
MEERVMPRRSKLSAVALLAAVLLAGGAAGWLIGERDDRDRRPRGRGPDAMVAHLTRELKLTPAQADSVRAAFARHRPEIQALWAQVRPRFDSIKAVVRAEIDAQLTPEQRAQHQRLVEEAEHHRRGDSTKAKPEGGRN